ncbi:MAG: hypothetical protein HY556_09350 [Euryarchaeota archaeon]|nr:hypothetical protein [Euryarchaeota archaeon]
MRARTTVGALAISLVLPMVAAGLASLVAGAAPMAPSAMPAGTGPSSSGGLAFTDFPDGPGWVKIQLIPDGPTSITYKGTWQVGGGTELRETERLLIGRGTRDGLLESHGGSSSGFSLFGAHHSRLGVHAELCACPYSRGPATNTFGGSPYPIELDTNVPLSVIIASTDFQPGNLLTLEWEARGSPIRVETTTGAGGVYDMDLVEEARRNGRGAWLDQSPIIGRAGEAVARIGARNGAIVSFAAWEWSDDDPAYVVRYNLNGDIVRATVDSGAAFFAQAAVRGATTVEVALERWAEGRAIQDDPNAQTRLFVIDVDPVFEFSHTYSG